MTFKQAMIVPTMVTLGCGTLLMAQNLSLVEVSYAAPAPQTAQVGGASAAGSGASDPAALPIPQDGAAAEFGGTGTKVIKAISDSELSNKALQSSGREDPFMALLPPDPSAIVPPPVNFPPIKPIPLVSLKNATPKPVPTPKIVDIPWSGDKAPTVAEPQWLVRGIMSTGTDRVTLLEGRNATVQAHIGDVLDDGSKVVAISSQGVTFIRGGRRFVKLIGGSN
ncbi:MAG TPA: hypothetical protein V6D47_21690 [Oscillatoriaceae cyanobacterium]